MVIGAFPAAKLGGLLVKQVSKPLATVIKNSAKNSPIFRKYVCMPPAQFYNWCEIKTKMWILNLGKPVNIPVLNESQAIELGANLLGEAIIFFVAAVALISEYTRQIAKEAAKEEATKQKITALQAEVRDLYIQTEEERAKIRELYRKLGDQDTQIQTLALKQGIKPKTPTKPEPPKESPSITPVNNNIDQIVNDGNPSELYQLSANRYSENLSPILLLKAVDEIGQEFWNYPTQNREDSYVLQGLYYLSQIFKF